MKELRVVKHPILQHKLGILRQEKTSSFFFRQILREISNMLAYEATTQLKTSQEKAKTPLEETTVARIAEDVIVASILRAGEGMLDGFLDVMPFARVGHIGIYRDKKMNNTVEYYFRLPDECEGRRLFLLDPLLATGDTALAALDRLKEYEVGPIDFVCVLASQEGIDKIFESHPDVTIHTLQVERELNEKGYLLPGLGDAGDRIFYTTGLNE